MLLSKVTYSSTRGHLGVQCLAQGHFGRQVGRTEDRTDLYHQITDSNQTDQKLEQTSERWERAETTETSANMEEEGVYDLYCCQTPGGDTEALALQQQQCKQICLWLIQQENKRPKRFLFDITHFTQGLF